MAPILRQQISQDQYAGIGKFIVEFSGLEGSIKLGIAMLAPLPEDVSHEILAGYDFAMACTVLEALGAKRLTTEDAKKLGSYLSRARGVNTERTRVAHGSWQLFGEFYAKHTSRQKLRVTEHFKNPKELDYLSEEASTVGLLIFSICFENFDVTRLGGVKAAGDL